MREYKCADKPYNYGQLTIAKNKNGEDIIHGVALNHTESYQYIKSFELGFPIKLSVDHCFALDLKSLDGRNRKNFLYELTLDEFLPYVEADLQDLKKDISGKTLRDAMMTSRCHYLSGFIDFLKETYSTEVNLREMVIPSPETGVFVITPEKSSDNFYPKQLESLQIVSDKKYTAQTVGLLVSHLFGNEFGSVKIPAETSRHFDSFNGSVMNAKYCAFEVPKYALNCVKNPVVVKIKNPF
jgi:hypothetical protein